MRDGYANLVHKIDKILLTEEDGDHEIGRCRRTNVNRIRCALISSYEDDQSSEVGKENDGEDFPVRGKKIICGNVSEGLTKTSEGQAHTKNTGKACCHASGEGPVLFYLVHESSTPSLDPTKMRKQRMNLALVPM